VEKGIGNTFISWYNKKNRTNYEFNRFGDDPPDLIYTDGRKILKVEITTEYYDKRAAQLEWQALRSPDDASQKWFGVDFDKSLVCNMTKRIAEKCRGTQDSGTILVVGIYPRLTTNIDFEEMRKDIKFPEHIPFSGIYAGGRFPSSTDTDGGYFYWQIW